MSYSCGVHDRSDTEEAAQIEKIDWICDAARVQPGHRVLDIGCGWGTCMDYLVRERAVSHVTGLTLSTQQAYYVERRSIPQSDVCIKSYLDYVPEEPFDALVSIGMLEHVATPEEARSGQHVDRYREYFRLAHEWTRPEAWFGLQLVQSARIPRKPTDIRELAWGTRTIFPGAITPRIEDVIRAIHPLWEVVTLKTRRLDYAITARNWHRRLVAREDDVRDGFGDDVFEQYERYLRSCSEMFQKGYLSLGQYSLRRLDHGSTS